MSLLVPDGTREPFITPQGIRISWKMLLLCLDLSRNHAMGVLHISSKTMDSLMRHYGIEHWNAELYRFRKFLQSLNLEIILKELDEQIELNPSFDISNFSYPKYVSNFRKEQKNTDKNKKKCLEKIQSDTKLELEPNRVIIINGIELTYRELSKRFTEKVDIVAAEFGLTRKEFAKIIRDLGFPQWPYQKIKCLIERLNKLTGINNQDADNLIEEINNLIQEIKNNPNMPLQHFLSNSKKKHLDNKIKQIRDAYFDCDSVLGKRSQLDGSQDIPAKRIILD